MLEALKKTMGMTRTENGAATYAGTGNDCLDLFSTVGALRGASDDEVQKRFMRAFAEDRDTAMKIAFYARDVRQGLGERKVFRTIYRYIAEVQPEAAIKNMAYIAEYGRFDDLLALMDTPCEAQMIAFIKEQIAADTETVKQGRKNISLLAKWLPSVNASSQKTVHNARKLASAFRMSEKEYRKTLVRLRAEIDIIENRLREYDYSFSYAKQPAKAMFKYRQAFLRNDKDGYQAFLERVSSGKEKMHTSTLYPYDIVRRALQGILSPEERKALDVTWNALPDETNDEDALVVVDGSGSMYWGIQPQPAAVAQSLAIYFAERNRGAFKNHFITFSENPQLVEVKGSDIWAKVRYCMSFDEVANTNIQKVFELILQTAKANKLSQKDMPKTIYIVSDMEFDACAKNADITNFAYAKKLYAKKGYVLPKLVFWNVASRNMQAPVTKNEQGVALVSGCSSKIFNMVTSGEFDPQSYMMAIIGSERYADITA